MTMVGVLDHLSGAIARSSGQVWSALARSLGEHGAAGRVALGADRRARPR